MEISFKASQSFCLREGWLQKALIEIKHRPNTNVFSKKDGVVYLGIGSNMVTSLKYWLEAANILNPGVRNVSELTDFGKLISKYDPFLENTICWQMIHVNLVSNFSSAPLYWCLFNLFGGEESFSKESFVEDVSNYLLKKGYNISRKYIEDDFSVLVRSYIASGKSDPEDNMDCPLSYLGLLHSLSRDQFRKSPISLELLSPFVVLWQIYKIAKKKKSVDFETLANYENGPCSMFNIDRNSLMAVISRLSNLNKLSIVKTAGLNTIYLNSDEYSLKDMFSDCFGEKR